MQFLMRNYALFLAEKGHEITIVSEDKSKFLEHPQITNHVLDFSQSASPLITCSEKMEEFVGCRQAIDIKRSMRRIWANELVKEIYRKRDQFDELVAPLVYNEFCFPFVYKSSRHLTLMRALSDDVMEEISFLHLSNEKALPLGSMKLLEDLASRSKFKKVHSIKELKKVASAVYNDYQSFISQGIGHIPWSLEDIFR